MPYTDDDWKALNDRLKEFGSLVRSGGEGVSFTMKRADQLYLDILGLMNEVSEMSASRNREAKGILPGRHARLLVGMQFLEDLLVLPDHVSIVGAHVPQLRSLVLMLDSVRFEPCEHEEPAPMVDVVCTTHQRKTTSELRVGDTTYHGERVG